VLSKPKLPRSGTALIEIAQQVLGPANVPSADSRQTHDPHPSDWLPNSRRTTKVPQANLPARAFCVEAKEERVHASVNAARMSVFLPERRARIGMKTQNLPAAVSCVFEGARATRFGRYGARMV
jgi:hypothetical protein